MSSQIANPHNKFERDFSFPSGHSQASSSIAFSFHFVVIQTLLRAGKLEIPDASRYAFQALLTMTFLTGVSRVYFGMHYPMDVIMGWIAGFGTAFLFVAQFPLGTVIEDMLVNRPIQDAYALAFILPIALLAVLYLICWVFPPNMLKLAKCQKIAQMSIKSSSTEKKSIKNMKISPAQWEDYIPYSGILAGIMISVIWNATADNFVILHKVPYQFHGTFWRRVGRVLVGFTGLLPAIGLIIVLSSKKPSLYGNITKFLLMFVCYFFLGLWITLVGPETANMLGF